MCKGERINVTRASMPPYEEYIEAIRPLWDTHWITNMGRYHMELENQLKRYLGVQEISLMVNGHMSLELAIQMMGFQKEGGEVITTPYSFISTTHAIVRNGLKPVFCDIKRSDATIDEDKIEELITDKTVAILPVHVYGNVCNVEKIQEIADKYSLKVIYDAAHAFGIRYKNRGIGSWGDASVFSFHATKVFNTIEGGAVTFKEQKYYEKLYNLKNFGIYDEELVVDIGANAKMNEFCAIMGLCNLRHIDMAIQKRKKFYDLYSQKLSKIKGIRLLDRNKEANNNYSYFPIVLEEDYGCSRDQLYERLKEHNIFCRKYFFPLISEQKCYRGICINDGLDNAKKISDNVLILPLYEDMEMELINKILEIISE
ncbi:MAG: DegT/DnrJ/EryC1/StrS family aminotransferase [Lachnospiraceae bacterium]|nr:DegT/DnrJ/EryC1/StrS family aminotransferase [Lachnospiraceae bacterium]